MMAALDWMPTLTELAGGPTGDGLKGADRSGLVPGFVKTTLDGVNQAAFLRQNGPLGARLFLLLLRRATRRGSLEELEVCLLRHGTGSHGVVDAANSVSLDDADQPQARPFRAGD